MSLHSLTESALRAAARQPAVQVQREAVEQPPPPPPPPPSSITKALEVLVGFIPTEVILLY